ncbi:Zn(II)2Cys6 transcription factor [Aspergillus mulundensis]|uniref:Putative Zn(II)2Cys6 transcription factor n=1 Tax=Aspergillus mulundensis TaxID=1810919 RepID=A0A3D8SIT9_9EURO|nr:putative Zn(II)2Cys6 transcription factor [Aspergillus mulundensis]RDW86249.1 putative Zn(II)2Cys6 transcription factor [Aspergillus mulundensis]
MEPIGAHPNKRRCGKDRIRVTRACDHCKKKKLRCSGTLPCSLCQRSQLKCEYTAGYTRGKVPPVPIAASMDDAVQHREKSTNSSIDSLSPSNPQAAAQNVLLQPEKQINLPSSGNSPEPHQTDMEGHYVGPASGVSFLIRVQKRLHEHISFPRTTPIFSFGDAPLPKYDPSFLVIPPKDEAKGLLDRYFDFAFPTHRFLHQPQAEAWFEDFYRDPAVADSPKPGAMAIRALLLMVFAHAKQCLPDSDKSLGSCVNSAVYFAASEHHLAAETGPVRLTSVQARLAQCFYLLGHSRINHCWSLFGTTARLAIAIGLHRGRRRDLKENFVELECSKRVFWCMYSLDNYLSAALGRPRIFHDDEIDQELPAIANDHQITSSGVAPAASSVQSIMLAPVYHAKLSKIISGILRDLYGIRRTTLQSQAAAATRHGADLAQWRHKISAFVDLPSVDMLMLTYQRQYTVLNLAFYHAQILLYRPFILKDFKNLAVPASDDSNHLSESLSENTRHCIEAAMKITGILRDLCENGRMYHTFWFTQYYAFSAIVVLYVHFIQSCTHKNVEASLTHFQAGERAQQHLAACGAQSSFARRYAMVLEELRKEAQKCIQQKQQPVAVDRYTGQQAANSTNVRMNGSQEPNVSGGSFGHERTGYSQTMFTRPEQGATHNSSLELMNMQPEQHAWLETLLQDNSPGTYAPSLTGWGEFDSLALTGLGELGYLFSSDNLPDFQG